MKEQIKLLEIKIKLTERAMKKHPEVFKTQYKRLCQELKKLMS